jgi:NADPH-dependent 2,4-dienoyl-CoA reductase/sulfur reductase-like enzyme
MEKILIVGGNAAGLTAASRAKRIDPRLNITVVEKLPQIAYSTCGLPYMLAKVVSPDQLISFTPEDFEKERGIKVHTQVRVQAIVPGRKRVEAVRIDTGEKMEFAFDRLLLATGLKARLPNIPGTDLKGVFTLTNLQEALEAKAPLSSASRIAIIGAGYAGLEFAESLHSLGKPVTVFERAPNVLPSVDADIAQIIEYELRRFGVQVVTSANVLALTGENGSVSGVKAASSLGIVPADFVLIDTGVEPNTDLAHDAGIQLGTTGGIAVDSYMETSFPGIFAAGNCAESFCAIRRKPVLSAVGTVAAKQGRIAGENLAARRSKFNGAIGTTVLKVFDLAVGRTGLTSREAAAERMPVVAARIEAEDRASYYPGARRIWVKLLVEREGRKLIGAQAIGYGDVARRIDVAATAISSGMRIDDVAQLDLAYSPPYGSLWDPFLLAAQAILRQLH